MSAKSFHALAVGALLIASIHAAAAPVTITTPFINFENRAINSLGFGAGPFLRFGANSVVPNGLAGTTDVATTANLSNGAFVSRSLNFDSSPVSPNFFSRYIQVDPNLFGPWTLTFTNGADSSSTTVALPVGASLAPFVNSITLSGTSSAPTFTWTPPPNTTVNGYRVNIYDKSLITPTNSGNIISRNLQPNVTSYTAALGDIQVAGYALALNKNYSIEISLIQTDDGSSTNLGNGNLASIARVYADFTLNKNYSIEISLIQTNDGSSTNLGNGNLASIARVYADFTLNNAGAQIVNLPVVLANGSYKFNMAVVPGQTYYIDPLVATGYDYQIGAGDPNFQTVLLPVGIGDGLYDIFGYDSNGNLVLLADNWAGGAAFNFGAGGLSRFRVTDIETAAGLDPNNTTAFVTGLSFTGAGTFTGTQTPITVDVPGQVSEPPMLALLLAALTGLHIRRRIPQRR